MKKNVAIIVQNLHNGGAERMAANMSKELAKSLNTYLIVFDPSEAIYSYGGRLIDLKVPPLESGSALLRVINTIKRVRRLRYIKKKYDIDISISHMGGANLANILSKRGDKVISVYHSMPSKEFGTGIVSRMVQQFIGRHSDRYVVVSKPALKDMNENFGVPADRLECIYNFVDAEEIRELGKEAPPSEAESFFASHDRVIVHAGRLTALKAQDRLIRLTAGLRAAGIDAGLMLLGDGEEKDRLKGLADSEGVPEHVFFAGEVRNPFCYIKKSDLFVLCSRYEGLPMVLIEALSLQCPVVSTDMRSGAREILAPETDTDKTASEIEYAEYGILIPPGGDDADDKKTEEMLLEASRRMLADEELRRSYLKRCDEAVERFSPEKIIRRWLEL